MSTPGSWKTLLCTCAVLALFSSTYAFKNADFKLCHQSHFCNRSRQLKSYHSVYQVSGTKLLKTFTAFLEEPTSKARLALELTAFKDGQVRLKITEPDAGRFEVRDVLAPDLDSQKVPWELVEKSKNAISLQVPKTDVVVSVLYNPFEVALEVNGEKQIIVNGEQKFLHELQRRAKQLGDPEDWYVEQFNSHKDEKKFGKQNLLVDAVWPNAAEVYGIPERATSMALKPTMDASGTPLSEPYRLYNLDVFEYLHESPFGLYGSIPLMLGHGISAEKGTPITVGMLWLNAAEMYVDVTKREPSATSTSWYAESGTVDLFLFPGPTAASVIQQYSRLTSTTALPPLFATGYHQCRWNYNDEPDVDLVNTGFDEHEMPADVIWLDIEHTDGKKYFTWDQRTFPTPVDMQSKVASRGRKMVTIVDPHIKRTGDYKVHTEATSRGLYIKNKEGKDYEGWCWPGSSSYLDFCDPGVRQYWAEQFRLDKYLGSTMDLFTWNDMNEPSVFNGPEVTMPKNNLHLSGVEHRDVHNLYGYYHHLATAQGLAQRGPGDIRPFVLSRAFFVGTQNVGPIWTGDNAADWHHLEVSVPMLLTLGLAGLPFSGADVGGFFGNPDVHLLVRWYQLGAFYPFFRGHAHQETKRREPWLFGEPYTTLVRNALRQRYQLLPYVYTLFYHAHLTNAPLMRPLFYEYPLMFGQALEPFQAYRPDLQFFLGPNILVHPIIEWQQTYTHTLLPGCSLMEAGGTTPSCVWYKMSSGAQVMKTNVEDVHVYNGDLYDFPVYLRGGFVTPTRERPRRSSAAQAHDPYTLTVAVGAELTAEGDLYEDDGITTSYKDGAFTHRKFAYADGRLRCLEGGTGGTYQSANTVERIRLLLPSHSPVPKAATVNGTPLTMSHVGDIAGGQYVISNPKLPISRNWEIVLEF